MSEARSTGARPQTDAARTPRVLHILGSNEFAGLERHVLGLVTELRRLGCRAEIACPRSASVLRREAAAVDVPLHSVLNGRGRVDILHVHDGRSALLGAAAATARHVHLVRTQHFVVPASTQRSGWQARTSLAAHRLINRRVDRYVCVSAAAAAAARERRDASGAKLVVIPPGVRLPPAREVEEAIRTRAETEHPIVATAGRLEPERRTDVLVEAIPLVLRRVSDCRFVIAGAGSAERNLKARARALGVASAIEWKGWLSEIGTVLSHAHVYVNTWPDEGFGMAVAEAMAFALPAIVPDRGASPELIEDNVSGRLFEALSARELADTISELLGDRTKAAEMGNAARLRANRLYSFRSTAESMLALYEQLARER